jgi:REP element-mobilizing transposase RayT
VAGWGGRARKLRVEYPGAIYHVMNPGDRREPIFRDDEDRQRFTAALEEACAKTAWQVEALCLMSNHFHLVVETPQANLVAGMKWFLGTYTSRFRVFEEPGAATEVVEGGSVAERIPYWAGQCGGRAALGSGLGATPECGGWRRVQGDSAGVVLWG